MNPAREFSLRPVKPVPPFLFQTEAELQFIQANGGGAYEIAAWVGLTRRANSARRPEFREQIQELAQLMGCRYRKAGALLKWLERIGLVQIVSSCDARGSFYSLGTICRSESSAHRHTVPIPTAPRAQAASVPGADSLQEVRSKINLQEAPEAAATLRVLAAHATRQLARPPVIAAEIEPTFSAIEAAVAELARWGVGECVRFVATKSLHGNITDTLNAQMLLVPEPQLRQICAFVYAKGNIQKPPWPQAKRAEVLTARLKMAQTSKHFSNTCADQPEILYAAAQ